MQVRKSIFIHSVYCLILEHKLWSYLKLKITSRSQLVCTIIYSTDRVVEYIDTQPLLDMETTIQLGTTTALTIEQSAKYFSEIHITAKQPTTAHTIQQSAKYCSRNIKVHHKTT